MYKKVLLLISFLLFTQNYKSSAITQYDQINTEKNFQTVDKLRVNSFFNFDKHSPPALVGQLFNLDHELISDDINKDILEQVTSVTQLSDVNPTDWAFQALQSLVERYGCIAGYTDSSFRGNHATTRYELAAAFNACLDQISDRFATKEDLQIVKALQEEFKTEITTIKSRVDGLESRTETLEAQQFSTTTKLQGEVVMAAQSGDFTQKNHLAELDAGASRPSALARVRLNFNTSFSGNDLLQTQLEVGNGGRDFFNGVFSASAPVVNPIPIQALLTSTSYVDLGGVDYANVVSNVTLRRLAYSFKPVKDLTLTVGPRLFPSDFIDFNSYANNSAQDFSSGFFINNPLIITNGVDSSGGAGGAFEWKVNGGPVSIRGLFVSSSPTNPVGNIACGPSTLTCNGGLLGDPYQVSAEVEYADTFGKNDKNNFAIRLQYTNSSTFNLHQNVLGTNVEITFGRVGFFGRYGISIDPQVTNVDLLSSNVLLTPGVDNLVQTWMVGLGVRDLLIPGSLLAIAVGQPFWVSNDNNPEQTNFEGFYRFPINDNITITPAVMVIANPLNTGAGAIPNNTIIQGLLRATFSF